MNKKMLFLTSFPMGELILVEVIEKKRPELGGGYYIRYANGGTDTTTEKFLFDVPYGLDIKKEITGGVNHCTDHGGYGFMSDCIHCHPNT